MSTSRALFRAATATVLVLSGGLAAGAPSPVARYRFAEAAAPGRDAAGGDHTAVVRGGTTLADAAQGSALHLDGSGGLQVEDTGFLRAEGGFAIACSVRFDSVAQSMTLCTKEGEWLLRLDPPHEGGCISFFVDLKGMLEPRVRGVRAEAGVWYDLVATWDGAVAVLWINGQRFAMTRAGALADTANPVLIGQAPPRGPAGLQGSLKDVRLYNQALTDGQVLQDMYGLGEPGEAPGASVARFEFAADTDGWVSWQADAVRAADGLLRAHVRGPLSALVRRGLQVPTAANPFLCLRFAADAGREGRVVFATTEGTGAVTFPVVSDGRMHSYVLPVGEEVEWAGVLTGLAIAPADSATETAIEFVRVTAAPEGPPECVVEPFYAVQVPCRAGRPCRIVARLRNTGGEGSGLVAGLGAAGAVVLGESRIAVGPIGFGETRQLSWEVQAEAAGEAVLRLTIETPEAAPATTERRLTFTTPVEVTKAEYVPPPQPADTGDLLIGAHYCPLWKQGSRAGGWEQIEPYPEREPALGWYDEDNPEVTDWEIRWALEHGIRYFVYCWYRHGQNKPVEHFLGHAIHDGLFTSRYGKQFQFAIMWENQSKGHAGVASEEDLLQNLLPYWIETYFKRPEYLKVDGKPLLFIYRPEYLVDDLGGVGKVRSAVDRMREACKAAGLTGLTILGEHRGAETAPLKLMVEEGLDYSFAYCWPVANPPTPEDGIRQQEAFWQAWQQAGVLPYLLTLSMGWDSTPWHYSFSKWRLPPADFERLCERAKVAAAALPAGSLGRRLILLDNWNEFGEGHYIAPHRQYGFGYLDAVRNAFSTAPRDHVDRVPADLARGPYDDGWQRFVAGHAECTRRVTAEGGSEPGLLAWWSFDDPEGSPYVLDYSGNGRGGVLHNASRAPGTRGQAMVCSGGDVMVPPRAFATSMRGLTVACWVRTEVPDQSDKWFVNNEYGDGASGFRLGLSGGKLTFAVPQSPWSHHLSAPEPLPLGRWVHVAGTYDGRLIRLYVDGRECSSLPRGGKVIGNDYQLSLGSYARDHKAFFSGLLDEVRIYARALTAEQLAAAAKR